MVAALIAALPAAGASLPGAAELAPGLLYRNDRVRMVPWSVHILLIDRARSGFELVTTLQPNGIFGLGPLTEQVRAIPPDLGRPLAAMNGDFYRLENDPYAGDPRGLQIIQGELVSAPDGNACFWIDPTGLPHISNAVSQLRVIWPGGETIPCGLNEDRRWNGAVLYTARLGRSTRTSGGRELILDAAAKSDWLPLRAGQTYSAQVREVKETGNTRLSNGIMVLSLSASLAGRLPAVAPGALLKLSMATAPDLSGVQTALGGGPLLLHGGKEMPVHDHKFNQRHPRAAVGWSSTHFFFVAVDGRQPGLSAGMTLPEFAGYLARQGCEEAMNLDGGGSVEMWIEGRIVNSPCYGFERQTANALVLLQRQKAAAP